MTTGQSIFDVWFVVHLCFWVFFGAQLSAVQLTFARGLVVMFGLALAWEVFERYAEVRWSRIWLHPESAANAIIGDVFIAGVLGLAIGYWLEAHQ